jgi:hypothetical protein
MPKLPADLPENWTQGQTISPNGTETGLTEQHGYNYLMKQVNNTQTEVNNINGALPDVAQQATVDEINNKIGTKSDADTQPTLFGRLAQVKNVLVEKLAELLTKVTGIDGKIGTSGDTAGTATLFGQVKDISEKMPTGSVKSVQRGIGTSPTGSWGQINDINISINTVDPAKCFVILHTTVSPNSSESFGMGCYVKELTSNKLSIAVGRDMQYSWQVIECF